MEVGWDLKSVSLPDSSRRIGQVAASSTVGMLLILSVILWGRRLSGAFQQSPSASVLFASALVLVGASLVLRVPLVRDSAVDQLTRGMLLFGATAAFILIGTLLTDVSTQPWWAWTTLWFAIGLVESFAYWKLAPSSKSRTHFRRRAMMMPNEFDEPELPVGVSQQFVRYIDPELGEIIHGKWRARFQAGQRNESVHLSFCPPLPDSPQLEVETVSGPVASTKLTLVVPHGARIDVRLDEPAEADVEVVLEVFVHQP